MKSKTSARDDAPVDMAAIETRIRELRTELDALRTKQLSAETIEVLLTDVADIWNWSGQLVSVLRNARDELYGIGASQRELAHQLRMLNTLLERRSDRRVRWRALIRQRPAHASPLADLHFGREAEAPREPSGENVRRAGELGEVDTGGGEA